MATRRKKPKEPVGMNITEIFTALELLEKERGIPRDFMLDKIIQAIIAAYKKDHPGVDRVEVDADEEQKTLRMFVVKTVVADEDYVDPGNEVPLEEAKKIYARYEPGDVVEYPVDNVEFGRIAAGNGKQVIIQGLREAERGMIYEEFNSRQQEILTATVVRIDPRNGNAAVRIGTGNGSTEAMLSKSEQIPGEEITEGMLIKVYVVNVNRSTRGPQILISRTHSGLVRRLFELEVPELYDGIVEIKAISREAGSRSKLSVYSHDENVDAIGACVGPRGQRVANVVAELRGEKIDVVQYSDELAKYVASALSPAVVSEVQMVPDSRACRVWVRDDQLSLAIGREGQNARLAARLTGCKIDIKPLSSRGTEDAWPPVVPPVPAETKPESKPGSPEEEPPETVEPETADTELSEAIDAELTDTDTLEAFETIDTELTDTEAEMLEALEAIDTELADTEAETLEAFEAFDTELADAEDEPDEPDEAEAPDTESADTDGTA